MTPPPRHSYVLRDTAMLIVFWLAVAGGAYLLIDAAIRSEWQVLAATAGIVAFALWVLWMCLAHPHVRSFEDRVVITNIGRVHDVPWSRVLEVRQHLNLVFELDDGRSIRALGVTAKRDRGLVLGTLTGGRAGAGSGRFHDDRDDLERLRAAAVASDAPAVSRWDVGPLVVGAVVTLAFVVDIALLAFG